uniref:phosphoenolpyruvate carboxykinase (ATP) n=1 Tax=Chlamydomonas euryale TaxID=1486919 RepID=A0A7R9VPY4_9CHLO|mmetsp:Transcript_40503/g.120824  ORF Transcript_40503/g.120824 Transcript_40503/m.120824 type:complete len:525 (+) Transcript_40503:196-1770(+)
MLRASKGLHLLRPAGRALGASWQYGAAVAPEVDASADAADAASLGDRTRGAALRQAFGQVMTHMKFAKGPDEKTIAGDDMLIPQRSTRFGHDPSFLVDSKHAKEAGLNPKTVYRNLTVAELYELALLQERHTRLSSTGALMTNSSVKKGRTPRDKRVVKEDGTKADVWWGGSSPNFPMQEQEFLINRQRTVDFLNYVEQVYVVDAFVNWKKSARMKIRVLCTRPYHALFMHNMLIRPTAEELADFGEPDFVIFNAGVFPANKMTAGMTSNASIDLSFKHNELVILGSQYAGEMKKGVFTVLNYLMPKRGVLSLHSGCNMGKEGDVSLFFGLSGTGKTTLSADPNRPLIGDDEHCWDDEGVFNAEGGCYAKAIGLKAEKEPDIWRAVKFGTILENVDYDYHTRVVDFDSAKFTENTRICYPIDFIPNAHIPCVGGHPKNIMLLCCDAFGVLPPVSKLTPEQAMYMFVSGYTAKVGYSGLCCAPARTGIRNRLVGRRGGLPEHSLEHPLLGAGHVRMRLSCSSSVW